MNHKASALLVRLFRTLILIIGLLIVLGSGGADLFTSGRAVLGSTQALSIFIGLIILSSAAVLSLFPGAIRIILMINTLLLSLLCVEFISYLIFRSEQGKQRSVANDLKSLLHPIADPLLGGKLPPNSPGHDARGFRNEKALSRSEIVAIGDSQTWGGNAIRQDTWPSMLSNRTRTTVYSMALGGYGPVQYAVLTEQALALSPTIILVAVYLGNDIWDAYHAVYQNNSYVNLRRQAQLKVDTIATKANTIIEPTRKQATSSSGRLMSFLGGTAIFMLAQNLPIVANRREFELWKAWANSHPENFSVYEGARNRTAFTNAYRLLVLDLSEPRIAEGLRITEKMLVQVQDIADVGSSKVLILIIPTKESAYSQQVRRQHLQMGNTYDKLIQMESTVRERLVKFCNDRRIHCFDLLPDLSEAIMRGEKIYPAGGDGHPVRRGYALIASAVDAHLKLLGWI